MIKKVKGKKMSKRALKKVFYTFVFIGIIVFSVYAYNIYQKIYSPVVHIQEGKEVNLYIPSDATFNQVLDSLAPLITDVPSFKWLAEKMHYKTVHPGRYILKDEMTNKELVSMLRAGLQSPVKVIFNNIETVEELSSVIGKQIEADSAELIHLLKDEKFVESLGFELHTIKVIFIPDTYEFYWNTKAEEFIRRMLKEFNKFWTQERIEKAERLNLTKVDVSTLASIVHKETPHKSEEPKIAGVYINRLRKRMRLQADPTVKYLLPDSVKRILSKHLTIESPYNTYLHYGLPPGPITTPPVSSIKAVLNYEDHDYLYFCAKDDFSRYHVFAKTYQQHIVNALKYQRELSKRKI